MQGRAGKGTRRRTRGAAICAATGKIRYRDGHEAALALRSLLRRASRADVRGGRHDIRVQRKYFCPSCGGWHLTSQAPGEWAWLAQVGDLSGDGGCFTDASGL